MKRYDDEFKREAMRKVFGGADGRPIQQNRTFNVLTIPDICTCY